MNGLTNATSQDAAWCPKHQIVKSVLSVRRHYPKRGRFTENLSIYLSSPAPNSLLQNPSNLGATASHWLLYILLFFFFLILNRMDAWSLMRGDAFIHFVSGSRRVNIRLGVLLLILKSPHIYIYIYIYIYNSLNNLSSGKSCLVAPGVAVPPWATETVLSPLVGGWWGQGIARAFTRCMIKKKLIRCTIIIFVSF